MRKKKVADSVAQSYKPAKKVMAAIKKAGHKLMAHKPKAIKMPKAPKVSKVKIPKIKAKGAKIPKPPQY